MSDDVCRINIAEKNFPLTIRAYREDTLECVWELTVEKPPMMVTGPPLRQRLGVGVCVSVEFAGGQRVWSPRSGHEKDQE